MLHNYRSNGHGPWQVGTTVEMDPDEAAWVNKDSPGTLAEVAAGVKLATGEPVPPEKLKGYVAPEPVSEPELAPEPAPPSEEIRAWARANGFKVADHGKLPAAVLDAYAVRGRG